MVLGEELSRSSASPISGTAGPTTHAFHQADASREEDNAENSGTPGLSVAYLTPSQ